MPYSVWLPDFLTHSVHFTYFLILFRSLFNPILSVNFSSLPEMFLCISSTSSCATPTLILLSVPFVLITFSVISFHVIFILIWFSFLTYPTLMISPFFFRHFLVLISTILTHFAKLLLLDIFIKESLN